MKMGWSVIAVFRMEVITILAQGASHAVTHGLHPSRRQIASAVRTFGSGRHGLNLPAHHVRASWNSPAQPLGLRAPGRPPDSRRMIVTA